MEAIVNATQSAAPNILISEYELERGKPMPSKNHAQIQTRLSFELYGKYRNEYSILSEISIKLTNDKATPDLAVFPLLSFDWQSDEISITEPPISTIEILSPTQALEDLLDKAEDYFSCGVKSCWIVLPRLTTILVMQANRYKSYFQIGDTLTDPATGITLGVDSIFSA